MSKSRKILSIIFCILILTILIPVLLDFHKVSGLGLQLFSWKLFTWKQIPFVGYYLSRYVFWGTVVLHGLIKDPTVSVNSRKNKCMVSVKGAIVPSENIIKRSQLIQEEIASGLTEFFGINHNVKLKISVSDFKPKEASGLAGIILACFILSFGFFKTLFVLICATLGAGIGYYIQNKNIFK